MSKTQDSRLVARYVPFEWMINDIFNCTYNKICNKDMFGMIVKFLSRPLLEQIKFIDPNTWVWALEMSRFFTHITLKDSMSESKDALIMRVRNSMPWASVPSCSITRSSSSSWSSVFGVGSWQQFTRLMTKDLTNFNNYLVLAILKCTKQRCATKCVTPCLTFCAKLQYQNGAILCLKLTLERHLLNV